MYTNGFDGIGLTHGMPEVNIWSFVAASEESYASADFVCPCINPTDSNIKKPPQFIGKNYFCDTATFKAKDDTFYDENPLWDGRGCMGRNMCCSFNSPPWFHRKLPSPTSDPIIMRIRLNRSPYNEDIAIEMIDINVY